MTTTNVELETIARYFQLPLVNVVQRDMLKYCPHVNNGFYIINLQPQSKGNGTHWTCLYLNKNTSFYFCSFGAPPPNDVVSYVKKYSKHLKHNNLIIQNLKSDNCGLYCIGFILFMVKNKYNYIEFINAFDEDDTLRNDGILEGVVRIYTNKSPIKELRRFFNSTGK